MQEILNYELCDTLKCGRVLKVRLLQTSSICMQEILQHKKFFCEWKKSNALWFCFVKNLQRRQQLITDIIGRCHYTTLIMLNFEYNKIQIRYLQTISNTQYIVIRIASQSLRERKKMFIFVFVSKTINYIEKAFGRRSDSTRFGSNYIGITTYTYFHFINFINSSIQL